MNSFLNEKPYLLPGGAKPDSDTTDADGKRTIKYDETDVPRSGGDGRTTVHHTIVIDGDGNATDTTKKDGEKNPTERKYTVTWDPNGNRIEEYPPDTKNGSTTDREVTFDKNGDLVKTQTVVAKDSTDTTDPKTNKEKTIVEYGPKRKKLKRIVEKTVWKLTGPNEAETQVSGTRTTTPYNADGSEGTPEVEKFNPESGEWEKVP